MMKLKKTAVLLAFSIPALFFAATSPGLAGGIAVEPGRAELQSSRSLYLANCARCHGSDGKSGTELGKLYSATDLTASKVQGKSRKKLTSIIRNGKGSMPSFRKKLTSEELSSVVTYIRSF